MKPLTKQERKVLTFIEKNPGCTTRDIIAGTYVTCPSGRISEMRTKGIPIISVGQKKYDGARAFEMYAVEWKDIPDPARSPAEILADNPGITAATIALGAPATPLTGADYLNAAEDARRAFEAA
jgi:hypothetical protein